MKLASWVYWSPEDLETSARRRRTIDLISRTGIDLALCVWGVEAAETHGAAIERLGKLLADAGVELHVGMCPFAPPARGVPRKRLYQFTSGGKKQFGNLCPSWSENRDLVVRHVTRMCEAAEAPGIHLDFIRYLFSAGTPWQLEWEDGREWIDTHHWCECEACAAARRPWLGRDRVTTYDRMHPGVIFKEIEYRKRNINEVLRRIRGVVDDYGRVLSIAQRVQYLNRAVLEGQDWLEWARDGLFAFTCPMNYSTSTAKFRERMTQNAPRLASRGSVKVYEGVSRKSSAGESSIDTVLEQMSSALELGADGVTLFHFGVLQPGEHERIAAWKRSMS